MKSQRVAQNVALFPLFSIQTEQTENSTFVTKKGEVPSTHCICEMALLGYACQLIRKFWACGFSNK
jgi:hypothetical protein